MPRTISDFSSRKTLMTVHHIVLKYVEVCTIAKPIEDTIKEQFGKEICIFWCCHVLSLEKKENKVTQSTLRSLKVKRAKIGYTFHPTRIPPYIFFKMCNPFYIGLKLPNVNEALWNRMPLHGLPAAIIIQARTETILLTGNTVCAV